MEAFGPRNYNAVSRLTRLYTQHKAVKPPVTPHDAPEILSLHRKFRIQKDRLIAWGLEWSDTSDSNAPGNIDESLQRAGFTELVSSIMDNIKLIFEELERMGTETMYSPGTYPAEKDARRRPKTAPWTREETAQYEDLIKDLTKALDLLCDLRRSRRSYQTTTNLDGYEDNNSKAWEQGFADEARSPEIAAFDHGAFKLDINLLIIPKETPPSYDDLEAPHTSRLFGHLRHSTKGKFGKEDLPQPVLIEYVTFDSIYRDNNIPLPLSRLEQLFRHIQSCKANGERSLPKPIGYFEDPHQPRYGLVFALPNDISTKLPAMSKVYNSLAPLSLLEMLQTASRLHAGPNTSATMAIPPLEQRFRLAHEIVSGLSFLNDRSFTHRDINSHSIAFLPKPDNQPNVDASPQYDLRKPLVCSFDLFSEFAIDPAPTKLQQHIYRHPDDPKVRNAAAHEEYDARFDLYSLGLVLLEIGFWLPVSDMFKEKYTLGDFKMRIEKIYVKKVAGRCGSAYQSAVQQCLTAGSKGPLNSDDVRQIYSRVKLKLDRCCILDDEEMEELRYATPSDEIRNSIDFVPPYISPEAPKSTIRNDVPNVFWDKKLPEEVETYWQTELGDTIGDIVDNALRKTKESMLLGLAYAGETEAAAKLTVVVACKSVELVTAALRRELTIDRNMFDVIVHGGKVTRSKSVVGPQHIATRSAGPNTTAQNSAHQQRPVCGASIGAWRNNEHMPPVTFGGVIVVDGQPFGMSVHHMLEDVEDEDGVDSTIIRSAGRRAASQDFEDHLSRQFSTVSIESSQLMDEGDTQGVVKGTGDEIYVTQPALDDVADKENFFAVEQDMDEDHLDSHTLGHVYASSGLRRTTHNGIKQEVDWALIKIDDSRSQLYNVVAGGKRYLTSEEMGSFQPELSEPVYRRQFTRTEDLYPCHITTAKELKSLQVHCLGRTSGLGAGTIAASMWQVRFPGRTRRSWTWLVHGGIGMPGDSGAWVVENNRGRVCGHILGWIGEYNVAIFSPMEMMMEDIKRTLGAMEVCLPGLAQQQQQEIRSRKSTLISATTTTITTIGSSIAEAHGLTPSRQGQQQQEQQRDPRLKIPRRPLIADEKVASKGLNGSEWRVRTSSLGLAVGQSASG